MNMKEIEELFDLAAKNGSVFGDASPGEIIKSILRGDPIFSIHDIIGAVISHFMQESTKHHPGSSAGGHLHNHRPFEKSCGLLLAGSVSNLGVIVCSCCVIVLCLKSFMDIYHVCSEAWTPDGDHAGAPADPGAAAVTMGALLPRGPESFIVRRSPYSIPFAADHHAGGLHRVRLYPGEQPFREGLCEEAGSAHPGVAFR